MGSVAFLILLANSVRPMRRDRVPLVVRPDVAFPDRFRVRMDGRRVRIWLHLEFTSSNVLGETGACLERSSQVHDVCDVPVEHTCRISIVVC